MFFEHEHALIKTTQLPIFRRVLRGVARDDGIVELAAAEIGDLHSFLDRNAFAFVKKNREVDQTIPLSQSGSHYDIAWMDQFRPQDRFSRRCSMARTEKEKLETSKMSRASASNR